MLAHEAVPFKVEEAPGGGWEMVIKFQLLPGEDLAEVREKLVPGWLTFGLTTMIDDPQTARGGSPLDNPGLRGDRGRPCATPIPARRWALISCRGRRPTPVSSGRSGVPAYGFSPFLIMNTDTLQVDRANERFAVPAFADGVELYTKLVRRLVSDT